MNRPLLAENLAHALYSLSFLHDSLMELQEPRSAWRTLERAERELADLDFRDDGDSPWAIS